jgi:hypothetical protein
VGGSRLGRQAKLLRSKTAPHNKVSRPKQISLISRHDKHAKREQWFFRKHSVNSIMCKILFHLILFVALANPIVQIAIAASQEDNSTANDDLSLSTWLVNVESEKRTRTLKFAKTDSQTDYPRKVFAEYGWTGERLKPIEVEIAAINGRRRVTLITPAKSVITLDAVGSDEFQGLFYSKDSSLSKKIQMLRLGPVVSLGNASTDVAKTVTVSADTLPKLSDIHLIWMGGNDCPPCRAWRGVELPKLRLNAKFQQIHFVYVTKSIESSVPPKLFLPEEVQPFKQALDVASSGAPGSPQAALLVRGQVYDYFYGARSADEIIAMLDSIVTGKPYPYARCTRMASQGRQCAGG